MKILAIETSCDETSAAVIEDGHIVHSLVINSQIDIHKAFGGVVPEIAARSHIEVMMPVVQQALVEAGISDNGALSMSGLSKPFPAALASIDAIAVTQGPGLSGSLLVGALTARTLAWTLQKPLYPVHHILGHIYANWITNQEHHPSNAKLDTTDRQTLTLPAKKPDFPVLALIVSGGHTQLMYATSHTDWTVIGRTQDDAVGEAFDKVAKMLGLPYPGGPSVEKAAKNGNADSYRLPTPKVTSLDDGLVKLRTSLHSNRTESYNFSFSGLKTAVLRAIQNECGVEYNFPSFQLASLLNEAQKADFAASFQSKAIEYLVAKTKMAFNEFQPKTLIIGGGVAASPLLRQQLQQHIPLTISYAPQVLCTDNAAMIGARAYFQAQTEQPIDPHTFDIKPSWPL